MSKEAMNQEQPAQQEPKIDIYRSFEQWKNGSVLEHGVPRTEYYSEAQLDLVEMGWNYGYDAGRAVEQALDKKAENAKSLGLDYEPRAWFTVDGLNAWADKKLKENPQWAEQPAQQGCMRCNTPKKCALYGCSPLTWPSEKPAQQEPVGVVINEKVYSGFGEHRPVKTVQWRGTPPPAGVNVYTSPQPAHRKPLTDADLGMYISKELAEYINGAYADTGCAKDQLIHFARAIEAAHGIKGEA